MKGIARLILLIVVIAIFAVVIWFIIDIAGRVSGPFPESQMTADSFCKSTVESSCYATGEMPNTWTMENVKINNIDFSCYEIMDCDSCETCLEMIG